MNATSPMTCIGCGDAIDEDSGCILREAGIKPDGPMCEGCAEDELDAARSGDADARERGEDYPDPSEARDPYDCEYDF
jgi:hypothetical protein